MKLTGRLLRICSYLFHSILSLFFVGLAAVTIAGGQHNLNLGMLPWKGQELTHWILGLGITGLVATLLAVAGWFRFAFPLWCLFVVVMMVRGYFLSPYGYSGQDEFKFVLWMLAVAVLAFVISLSLFRSEAGR